MIFITDKTNNILTFEVGTTENGLRKLSDIRVTKEPGDVYGPKSMSRKLKFLDTIFKQLKNKNPGM